MKQLPLGHTETLRVRVTPEMTVQFSELGPLHPVYATYQMARHFEEAGRKLLLPFLEEGESSIGIQVEVQHTGSALPGMEVCITAEVQEVSGRRIVCALRATTEISGEIGRGTATQLALEESRINANFEALQARWQAAQKG